MKITTWNVNSIRARLDKVTAWLCENKPDFLCLQETKVQDSEFPEAAFSQAGYASYTYGQKSYNGVSIHFLSSKINRNTNPVYGFSEEDKNTQKRIITLETDRFFLVNAYIPQGEDVLSAKFEYKLSFLNSLKDYLKELLLKKDVIITGDFNIAADERDIYNPEGFKNKVMFHPKEHAFFEDLKNIGLKDSLRLLTEDPKKYTWWDYRGASLERNNGIRLDYIWISETLSKKLLSFKIDADERTKEKPSDHVPYTVELDI